MNKVIWEGRNHRSSTEITLENRFEIGFTIQEIEMMGKTWKSLPAHIFQVSEPLPCQEHKSLLPDSWQKEMSLRGLSQLDETFTEEESLKIEEAFIRCQQISSVWKRKAEINRNHMGHKAVPFGGSYKKRLKISSHEWFPLDKEVSGIVDIRHADNYEEEDKERGMFQVRNDEEAGLTEIYRKWRRME